MLITQKEAAKRLGCSEVTLIRLARRYPDQFPKPKEGPARMILLFDVADLDKIKPLLRPVGRSKASLETSDGEEWITLGEAAKRLNRSRNALSNLSKRRPDEFPETVSNAENTALFIRASDLEKVGRMLRGYRSSVNVTKFVNSGDDFSI